VLSRHLLTLALLAIPVSAAGQQQTPQQFLASIYEPYKNVDFKGHDYRQASRYFTPDLTAAMDKDFAEAQKKNEVPTLDGDPFIDAQDWKIGSLAYATSINGDKAAGAVAFTNFDEPKAAVVNLVKTPAGWRISEIVTANGSLRALFKLK
jgi:hypothetical protein